MPVYLYDMEMSNRNNVDVRKKYFKDYSLPVFQPGGTPFIDDESH
jgi:hypothetical protein